MDTPYTENRPWGWFRQFSKDEKVTVKILFIKMGEAFSLQKHSHRAEFWRVLSGSPIVTVGDEKFEARAGDEFEISSGMNHWIQAESDDVEVLEIARGKFDENDIIRVEDKYGRV